MKMRRLPILLVVWCVLLTTPAILVELGLFGKIDAKTTVSGPVILLWVGGYLAQFGVFMWIMALVDKPKILWWFAASLLPWAIDWTIPVNPLYAFLWFPIVMLFAIWIGWFAFRTQSLQTQGLRAVGTVLEVLKPRMNVVVNRVYIQRKVRLRIQREDGTPAYEGVLKGLFMLGEIPSPGDRIPLRVDPKNPQHFDYDKGADNMQPTPSPTEGGSLADELAKLTALRERGALTDSEFQVAKKKLLGA